MGDLFYYPLARTVMGGLISSSVLTLIVLPCITLGGEGFAARLRGLWAGSAPVVQEASPSTEGHDDLTSLRLVAIL